MTRPGPPGGATASLPPVVQVRAVGPLQGRVRPPGDKSISHRALILAALADGVSVLRGLSAGDDVRRTAGALVALGADLAWEGPGTLRVTGGRHRLHPPAAPLDCGNSGTGMRLLAGVAAGLPWRTELVGDESLSARPMDRVAVPLRSMGAQVEGRGDRCLPPLTVTGGELRGITYTPPVASAQVKSAILLAGLSADGTTIVREPVPTRSHTEEMLAESGADVTVEPWGAGRAVRVRRSALRPVDRSVPGDPSQAAFWVVAACLVPGSSVTVEHVYAGAERVGFLGVLARMGARVRLVADGPGSANLAVESARLRATVVEAAEIPSLDEVPVLAVAAAAAEGTTTFRDVGELRVKEVDRLAATAALVEAFGARAVVDGDVLHVEGAGARGLIPGSFESRGDHRMAMAAVVAALAAGGTSTVAGFEAVATSYPEFLSDLGSLAGPGAAGPPGATRVPDRGTGRGATGRVVAIDGPAGSGKSSVSKELSRRLGMPRLDTGAMYRAVTWAALRDGIDLADGPAVARVARQASVELEDDRVLVDGTDVTVAIRAAEVNRAVSVVAAHPEVRQVLVAHQRAWVADHGGGVVEGRDIGTVVFPRADLKVFLTASEPERARRRAEESPEGVARRDRLDSTRAASPLAVATGARVIDTTTRGVDDVVAEILSWL